MNDQRRQFLEFATAFSLAALAPLPGMSKGGVATGQEKKRTTPGQGKNAWKCVYTLDSKRRPISGRAEDLVTAIRRGADLRIGTEFRHNEHIDTKSTNPELIREVADFRVTYLLEDRWVAGIMNLRQPVELPTGFGPRPSMSFFLYNQDGRQAIARPYLDGGPTPGKIGPAPLNDYSDMPKYHQFDNWDADTNAPSHNFIYDFETFRFWVSDDWTEAFSHTADGQVLSGSLEALTEGFSSGREIKVGIGGLCTDMTENPAQAIKHEVFIQCGPGYYYTVSKCFLAGSQPVVRVRPGIPMAYRSKGWDFGWLVPRSDGFVARWLVDPYTLKFHKSEGRYPIRWFVR